MIDAIRSVAGVSGLDFIISGESSGSFAERINVRRSAADLLLVADDLTGAAEAATALVRANGGNGVPVHLLREGENAPGLDASGPLVIDTNTRNARVTNLSDRLAPLIPLMMKRPLVVKKIDSLLRGGVVAEIEYLLRCGRRVVLAPALPAAGRIVHGGRVLVDGRPLAQTSAWEFESSAAPDAIWKSFSEPSIAHLSLDTVRSAEHELADALASASIVVCDSETDEDLRRIASAALHTDSPLPILVGSSALVAAVAQLLSPAPSRTEARVQWRGRTSFIVGTAEPSARRQLVGLKAEGCTVLRFEPAELASEALMSDHRRRIAETLASPLSAVTISPSSDYDPRLGATLSGSLAEALRAEAARQDGTVFVLTGGQTARAVLDAWNVRSLTVHRRVDGDAARGVTDTGIPVITRPGSFGGDDGFMRILRELRADGERRILRELDTLRDDTDAMNSPEHRQEKTMPDERQPI